MSKVEKTCLVCGIGFHVFKCRAETAVTCSRVCSGKWQAMGYAKERAKIDCEICGTQFFVPQCHKNLRRTCSKKCRATLDSRKDYATGKDSHNWKGGIVDHSDGYLYLSVEKHPFANHGSYVLEHRVVMEQWMREENPDHKFLIDVGGKKYLAPHVVVHHIDENKRNNGRKNLLVCTHHSHRLIHSGNPPMDGEVWPDVVGMVPYKPSRVQCKCATCGKEFSKKRSDVDRAKGVFYCSRECYRNKPSTSFKIEHL